MIGRLALLVALLAVGASAGAQAPNDADRLVARWTSPTLTRFRSEAEFRRYMRDLGFGEAVAPPPPPPPPSGSAPPPPRSDPGFTISAQGAVNVAAAIDSLPQVIPANPAITNVQEIGVDEGDIVKQVGDFLLVLQDGRIFSIDTRPGGRPGLALADRVNVYHKADDDAWYDEMLVYGDRVVITGYSYGQEASQISVLRVGADGRIRHEGTFFLSSDDYYDSENYATRLVGDRLIIYTPYPLESSGRFSWPALRRWRPGNRPLPARPLFDARSIYRPIADTHQPIVHTVSICRLGSPGAVRGLACESTAFVGYENSEFYVTPTDAYLWVEGSGDWYGVRGACAAGAPRRPAHVAPAFVYRVALHDGGLTVAGMRGRPVNQMSLAVIGGDFHALARWAPESCRSTGEVHPLTFVTLPPASFGRVRSDAPAGAYTPLPGVGTGALENRYTDRALVYGGRPDWGSFPPAQPLTAPVPVVVVPVAEPAGHRMVQAPHGLLRIERAGSDIVLTGYQDGRGLQLSLLDLEGAPRIASTLLLADRYESEGRSHAFNSAIGADGSGLMGVPTVPRQGDAGRWWSRSGASDLSFVSVDAGGQLRGAGDLLRGEETGSGYECEVSCVDWYGNSRPIFTGGRVFALTGTELIEGEYVDGRIRELRRLDVAAASTRRR